MKYSLLHIIFIASFINSFLVKAQQSICYQSLHDYSVDTDENNGIGTVGSIYQWDVTSDMFEGQISYDENSSNKITIDWGTSPPGVYQIKVTEVNSNGCSSQSELNVWILEGPDIAMVESYICPNGEVTLNAPNSFESYEWFDESGNSISTESNVAVQNPGLYSLTVFDGQCQYSTSAQVTLVDLPTIEIETDENNTVSVSVTGGTGPYSYQLESQTGAVIIPYQNNPVFYNIEPGLYFVKIKSLRGDCETIDLAIVLFIPDIITPNGDHVNDEWHIKGLIYFPESVVEIYDRYGKLLQTLNENDQYTWDGKYMGRALPSDTYWYRIIFKDGKTRKGRVTIKNRNSLN